MRVGYRHLGVCQQFFHSHDVHAWFEKTRSKGVQQGMPRDPFDLRFFASTLQPCVDIENPSYPQFALAHGQVFDRSFSLSS